MAYYRQMPARFFDTALGLCRISWEGNVVTAFALPPASGEKDEGPAWIEALIGRVQAHLDGVWQDFSDVPYAWEQVSDFQRAVYETALRVKAGETWSYGQLTKAIGHSMTSARAVGTALGQNPWPLLVPCHRFVGAGGKMTGFSAPGGIKTKLRLLALEGSELFAE